MYELAEAGREEADETLKVLINDRMSDDPEDYANLVGRHQRRMKFLDSLLDALRSEKEVK